MGMDVQDDDFMLRAAELAVRGLGHTRPNPAVGAVIVKDGVIIGEGWHKKAGGDHAEVAAIKNAVKRAGVITVDARRRLFRGSVIYVTLEPCSRPGRVGACTDAIAEAGISRVVYAVSDPNPKNRGKAGRILARRGVKCGKFKGDRKVVAQCENLIRAFRKHVLTGMPYLIVKIAMSLDGRICDDWGNSNWISCSSSRKHTNSFRERVDAIMVGARTVRKDDPSLLARIHPNRDLIRVVISKSGNLPKNARIFTDAENQVLVFDDAEKALVELGRLGITSVLCEGGLSLAGYLADRNHVDEWLTVTAPVFIGGRPISQAIRGRTFLDRSFILEGDSFFHTGLSEFSR